MSTSAAEATRSTLRLSPDPGLAATARLFVAAIARRAGVDEERIDDAKLAVTEACAAAIDAQNPVEIDVTTDTDRLAVAVRGTGIDETGGAPDAPIERLDLIRALFEDVETSPGAVGFSLPLT